MEKKCDIGLIGLAVMGENLALNIAGRGYRVAVYNRSTDKVKGLVEGRAKGFPICGAFSVAELTGMLARPRKVLLMVKAGEAVDKMIAQLEPHLEPGDILIDGGNSFYADTRRRYEALQARGILYLGVGISGGEEGALTGPSIMPGGDRAAYDQVAPILTNIAAKVGAESCCGYVGPDGAGHYVKMVHNGIEYGDMQLISEAYIIMKEVLGLDYDRLQAVFRQWNQGQLESYLIEITADILGKRDDVTGRPIVEVILDKAGQKGTGRWVSQDSLELGVPVPTITEAVFARSMSEYKEERVAASGILKGPEAGFRGDREALLAALQDALYASKICSYAQGFALLKAASEKYGWNLQFGEIAMLWRGGCIIRARFLQSIRDAYSRDPQLANLLIDPFFAAILNKTQANWRKVVATCQEIGVPIPAFSASLAYFDSYRRAVLPANLIQGQRDYFGAHTYQRTDRPGIFHTEWLAKD
ncbi:MAG: decarboxylating NADP(+)-dependent phosphogluconate dehydrogenase [Negativicutes bacterium]|nr:decarboxylating NADP(+)-dependent phosphogluconate dehydrogenase [Negativicutes bacterium]